MATIGFFQQTTLMTIQSTQRQTNSGAAGGGVGGIYLLFPYFSTDDTQQTCRLEL